MNAKEIKELIEEKIELSLRCSHTHESNELFFSDMIAYGVGDVDNAID